MIEQAIIKTLSFFAIWNYPLTREEVYKWLYMPSHTEVPSFDLFCVEIEVLLDQKKIQCIEGRIALASIDMDQALSDRQQKWWWAKERITLAQKAVQKVKWIPGLQAVFVCNILPVTVHEKSDIDVFIVTKPGTLWFVRLCTTLILSLFSLRRNTHDIDKHICLSFYVSSDALHFFNLQKGLEDIYLFYWLATLIPVYDSGNIIQTLVEENGWLTNSLPHFSDQIFSDQFLRKKNKKSKRKNRVLLFLNTWTKKIQLEKMKKNVCSKQYEDTTDVIINDYMLKFHEKDQRETYAQEWKRILEGV